MYIPTSKWTWAFFISVLTQAIIGLALEAYVFGQFQSELHPEAANPHAEGQAKWAKTIPTQLALLIFAFVYELLLVYDALSNQNTIQVIGIVVMNFGILVYTGIQKEQIHEAYRQLVKDAFIPKEYWSQVVGTLIVLPCLVALFSVILAFIAWKLYQEFGWKIYKQIGADIRMKRRFLVYQIYIALLKFDFFLFVGFAVQFLVIVNRTQRYELGLTIAALPIMILLLVLAGYSAQRENVLGTIIALIVYFVAMAYFIFKLVRMYNSERAVDYLPARTTLTVFAVMTILLIVVTIAICAWCWSNYQHGLKAHTMHRGNSVSEGSVHTKQEYYMESYNSTSGSAQGGPGYQSRPVGGTRMEID